MTAAAPAPHAATRPAPDPRAGLLTRWSLLLVAASLAIWLVVGLVGLWLLHLLGLYEGDIFLSAHNAGGWAAEIGSALVSSTAPVAGIVVAVAALRRHARWGALLGMLLNAVVLFLVLFAFVQDVVTHG